MTETISLEYGCGCRDQWQVQQLNGEAAVQTIAAPCIPASCQTCQARGMCSLRQAMPPAYAPVEWTDIKPPRRVYRRMKVAET